MFEEVTFRLGAGDRVGLVGKNGAGKSTMLKILAKDFAPDSGVISQEKEVRIGFLRQDIDFEQTSRSKASPPHRLRTEQVGNHL